jgi:hypothetical protein
MFAMGAKPKMPKDEPAAGAAPAQTAPPTPGAGTPALKGSAAPPTAPATPEPSTPRAGGGAAAAAAAGGDAGPTPPATPGGAPLQRAGSAAGEPGAAAGEGAAVAPKKSGEAKRAKKEAKKEAKKAAAGAGPEQQPMQLLLDVSLDAPIVVLPVNSHSPDHLEIDLGTLLVKNRIVWERRGTLGAVSGTAAPAAASALAEGGVRHQKVLMDDMTVRWESNSNGGDVFKIWFLAELQKPLPGWVCGRRSRGQ